MALDAYAETGRLFIEALNAYDIDSPGTLVNEDVETALRERRNAEAAAFEVTVDLLGRD